MPTEENPTCSLREGDLRARLAEIAAVGAESLIARELVGGHHLLHFRSNEATRRRLEAIVAAEARCCSFLDLSLEEQGGALVLSVAAPEGGLPVADELAAAFSSRVAESRRAPAG